MTADPMTRMKMNTKAKMRVWSSCFSMVLRLWGGFVVFIISFVCSPARHESRSECRGQAVVHGSRKGGEAAAEEEWQQRMGYLVKLSTSRGKT